MKISKKNIYKIGYTSTIQKKMKNKKWTSRLLKLICENKIISISIVLFVICVCVNLTLIYNFLKILEQI